MRHVIHVVGSHDDRVGTAPKILPREGETQRQTTWYACRDQQNPSRLLGDAGSVVAQALRAPFLAYNFYQQVHSTRAWSGKRPLIVVRGRSFANRVAAYAGRWGGGDVVMPVAAHTAPLGPTRYLLHDDGRLELRAD